MKAFEKPSQMTHLDGRRQARKRGIAEIVATE
jgi:hypothetical protein